MGRLDGQSALITGAARGQGEAEARLFAAEGAHVILADILVGEGTAVAAELGASARFVELDVGDSAAWERALRVPDQWPPLRILVNNAAAHRASPIEHEDPEALMRLWRTNLLGPFLGVKHAVPILRAAGGGSIVNVASTAALTGIGFQSAYTASKFGVRGLTKAAAVELGQYGIRVNAVHPGPIDTIMMRSSPTYANRGPDHWSHLALGRCGEPGEVALAVLFLASDESSYVTGADIAVDGGMTAGTPPRYQWRAEP